MAREETSDPAHAPWRASGDLPIDAALPELVARLAERASVVLHAPPGSGKTTRAPLALLGAEWLGGRKIVMLEPRRIAARASAERLAESLGEPVGQRVGYRIRDESKVSHETKVEVVTEGVLTRMLQSDPSLDEIGCVIFDEFHERSIHADLGLALCLEAQDALRPDLRLLVMSATLDVEAVAGLLGGAPVVAAEGRAFPVETRYLDKPLKSERSGGPRFPDAVADLVLTALGAETQGDVLVFLPGQGEIRRVEARLAGAVDENVDIRPIHGALPLAKQRAAIAPSPPGRRKIVLATSIAETSLTIEGVRVVVDGGRARRGRFDSNTGMNRLVTTRVSKAAAEQRRGRAGRVAPGVCYRLWTRGEEGAAPAFDPAEILEADLAPLALDLALWGARPGALAFLDTPPENAFSEAEALLRRLDALDAEGRITDHGRALAATPVHPRLGHMLIRSGASEQAARLAALLEERDPLSDLGEVDLARRLEAIARPAAHPHARGALERIAERARQIRKRVRGKADRGTEATDPGSLVALAFPDRVARRRAGDAPRYLLSGGTGAALEIGDRLAGLPLLAVAELTTGSAGRPNNGARGASAADARIRLAAAFDEAALEALFPEQLAEQNICFWDARSGRVLARRQRRFEALTLADDPWPSPPADALCKALLEGAQQLGLAAFRFSPAAARLRARVARARAADPEAALPDFSDTALTEAIPDWLEPWAEGLRSKDDLSRLDMAAVLDGLLDWPARQALDRLVPKSFTTPAGRSHPIDYSGEAPRVSARLQELYGVTAHPRVAGQPVLFELLSPAQRPIQMTADLPGFWAGSYADVAKEMRAKYPRHDWPTDPSRAAASTGSPRRNRS